MLARPVPVGEYRTGGSEGLLLLRPACYLAVFAGYGILSGRALRRLGLARPRWTIAVGAAFSLTGTVLTAGAPFGWLLGCAVPTMLLGALTTQVSAAPRPVFLTAVTVGLAVVYGYGSLVPEPAPEMTPPRVEYGWFDAEDPGADSSTGGP